MHDSSQLEIAPRGMMPRALADRPAIYFANVRSSSSAISQSGTGLYRKRGPCRPEAKLADWLERPFLRVLPIAPLSLCPNDRFGWRSQWVSATPAVWGNVGVRACQFSINRQDRSPMPILSRAFARSDCDRARPLESLKLQYLPVVSGCVASTG